MKKILDENTIWQIGRELLDAVERPFRYYCLDCWDAEYWSAAFLGKLITFHRRLEERDKKLVMCDVPPDIRQVFDITGLNRFFVLENGRASALTRLPFFETEECERVLFMRIRPQKVVSEEQVQQMKGELLEVVANPVEAYCINWGGCDYFTTAGFGALISFHKKITEQRKRLVLYGIVPSIYESFAITRLNRLFEICEDEQQALDTLRRPAPLLNW